MGRLAGGYRVRLTESNRDFVRTVASVCFTDLVGKVPRTHVELVLGRSVIGRRPSNGTISDNVDRAAISRTPGENRKTLALLPPNRDRECNATTAAGVSANQPVTGNSEIIDQAEEVIIAGMY